MLLSLLDIHIHTVYTVYIPNHEVILMQVQIKPWGNSHGIRLSKSLLRDANIQPNDTLQIRLEDSKIILSKVFPHRSLKERAAAYGGQLNLSEEIDWGEPVGNEVW